MPAELWLEQKGCCVRSFKSVCAKLKNDRSAHAPVVHLVVDIQAMIYDAARVRRLSTKFQVNTSKDKNFHFEGSFLGGAWGRGIGLWSVSNID